MVVTKKKRSLTFLYVTVREIGDGVGENMTWSSWLRNKQIRWTNKTTTILWVYTVESENTKIINYNNILIDNYNNNNNIDKRQSTNTRVRNARRMTVGNGLNRRRRQCLLPVSFRCHRRRRRRRASSSSAVAVRPLLKIHAPLCHRRGMFGARAPDTRSQVARTPRVRNPLGRAMVRFPRMPIALLPAPPTMSARP